MSQVVVYTPRYWRANSARLYCSHLDNGMHCRNQVVGWMQGDTDYGVGKVFRYCYVHKADAEAHTVDLHDVAWYTVDDLVNGKLT